MCIDHITVVMLQGNFCRPVPGASQTMQFSFLQCCSMLDKVDLVLPTSLQIHLHFSHRAGAQILAPMASCLRLEEGQAPSGSSGLGLLQRSGEILLGLPSPEHVLVLMRWSNSNPHSCPTSESYTLFSIDLLFCSLLKVVFQSVHFLVDANLSVSHSFEKYLVLYNICGFLVTRRSMFRVSFPVYLSWEELYFYK